MIDTCPLLKELIARLRADKIKIHRIWLPPADNPEGVVNVVVEQQPNVISFSFACDLNEGNVLRYRNARDLYFYPPRKTIEDLMADYHAAQEGRLYA